MQKSIIIKCTASNKQFSKRKWPSLSQIPTRVHLYCSRRLTQVHLHCSCSLLAVIIIFHDTNNGKSIDYGSTAGGLSLAIQRFNLSGYAKEPYQRSCQILQEYMNYTESSDNPYRIISNWLSTINYIFTSSVYPLNEIFRDRLQHQNWI